jgi:hypothetical protein
MNIPPSKKQTFGDVPSFITTGRANGVLVNISLFATKDRLYSAKMWRTVMPSGLQDNVLQPKMASLPISVCLTHWSADRIDFRASKQKKAGPVAQLDRATVS